MIEFLWYWTMLFVAWFGLVALWTLADWLRAQKPWYFGNWEGLGIFFIHTPWWNAKFGEGFDPRTLDQWSGIEIYRRIPGTTWGPPRWQECYRLVYSYEPASRYWIRGWKGRDAK